MKKEAIGAIKNAPAPSGSYSPAIRVGNTVYLAGQIPLCPTTGELVSAEITAQVRQVFANLQAVAEACGGNLDQMVKLTIYLQDLRHFPHINQIMPEFFTAPYPARTTIEVAGLPKNALIEVDGILVV